MVKLICVSGILLFTFFILILIFFFFFFFIYVEQIDSLKFAETLTNLLHYLFNIKFVYLSTKASRWQHCNTRRRKIRMP